MKYFLLAAGISLPLISLFLYFVGLHIFHPEPLFGDSSMSMNRMLLKVLILFAGACLSFYLPLRLLVVLEKWHNRRLKA